MLRFIILAATASVAFVSPSFADPDPQETPYEVVYFGDLNLKYDADADQMMRRIDRASNNVCNDTASAIPACKSASTSPIARKLLSAAP